MAFELQFYVAQAAITTHPTKQSRTVLVHLVSRQCKPLERSTAQHYLDCEHTNVCIPQRQKKQHATTKQIHLPKHKLLHMVHQGLAPYPSQLRHTTSSRRSTQTSDR